MSSKSEKMKAGASGLLDQAKKGFFRTKQRVSIENGILCLRAECFLLLQALSRLGKTDTTVDVTYSQEKERFLEHYKNVKKVSDDVRKLNEILKSKVSPCSFLLFPYFLPSDLAQAQAVLADDFHSMFDTKAELYNAALKNQDTAKYCDNTRSQLVLAFCLSSRLITLFLL